MATKVVETRVDGVVVGTATVEVPAPVWDVLAFTRRFTQAERIALRTLAKSNTQAEDFLDLLNKATVVRADDADVLDALAAFEAAGLLDVGRAAVILSDGDSP